jgi:hypothetical protein
MTTYVLVLTKTAVNVPTIDGDLYPEDLTANTYMFSATFGASFVADVTLRLYESVPGPEDDILVPYPISTASSTLIGYTGVTFQVTDTDPYAYVIRLTGVPTVDFPATYSFVLDQPDPALPFPTLDNVSVYGTIPDNFFAVYNWVPPPNPSWVLLENVYNFTVDFGTVTEASVTLDQYIYWNQTSARAAFQNLVNSGDA